jgi:glycine/D-amino acid oxidase-like deaminating enzyme
VPGADAYFVATGHSTLGMTLGSATGRAVAHMVLRGTRPEVLTPFDPERFSGTRKCR